MFLSLMMALSMEVGTVSDKPASGGVACAQDSAVVSAAVAAGVSRGGVLVASPPTSIFELKKNAAGVYSESPVAQDSSFWSQGWKGEPPSSEVVSSWYSKPMHALDDCAANPLRKATSAMSGQISVSAPSYNSTRTAAILLVEEKGEGLSGGLRLLHLRYSDGVWKMVGEKILAVA